MVILLEPEVYQEETVATLVGAGHVVKCLRPSEPYDFVFGPRACRIPGDPTKLDPAETMRLIGVAVKSMETLKKVQDKHAGAEPPIKKKRTAKPSVRKAKKGKGKTDGTGEPSDPSGDGRTGSVEAPLEGTDCGAEGEVPQADVPPHTAVTLS